MASFFINIQKTRKHPIEGIVVDAPNVFTATEILKTKYPHCIVSGGFNKITEILRSEKDN